MCMLKITRQTNSEESVPPEYVSKKKPRPPVDIQNPSILDTILPIPLHNNDYQLLEKVSLTEEIGRATNVTWLAQQLLK